MFRDLDSKIVMGSHWEVGSDSSLLIGSFEQFVLKGSSDAKFTFQVD